jgi:hypothetical protein
MQPPDPVPFDTLFDDRGEPCAAAYAALLDADVILGVDVVSQRQFLVFGRKAMRRVLLGGAGPGAKVLRVALRQDTEELAKFLALVVENKGLHEYQPEDE